MPAQTPASTDSNELSDIELVDRLLRGVPGAFDLFYQRYNRLIYHCIRVRVDEADVGDLFQGFFERLVGHDYHILKLWRRGTSLPTYLSRVIRNFVTDFHRTKRSRQKIADTLSGLELIDTPLAKEGTTPGAPLKGEEITPAIELSVCPETFA